MWGGGGCGGHSLWTIYLWKKSMVVMVFFGGGSVMSAKTEKIN